ncbi:MAG: Maf family protein [Candidatus Omnitrophica bacterium]|nr:Maf family protein [Candidatus Omnitrophota bacterium]
MRKIILASKSKARKQILKQLGLPFIVSPADVCESHRVINGYDNLVINNALKKAEYAALGKKTGIVIAADTVVVLKDRIIGKPKSLQSAYRILSALSRSPHWVYSGLALIDIDSGRIVTDYDRTKIYMRVLKKSEIEAYFSKVSPFDKAGGFDIQGLGGLFIERIEGCFYNVVGLPVSKLIKSLKLLNYPMF